MMNFEYKGKMINVEAASIFYKIAMLTKYETMAILKDKYKESWTEKAESLFHQEYDHMEAFIEQPDKSQFLKVIYYGEMLKMEIGMTPEEEQHLASFSGEIYSKLGDEKQNVLAELTRQLMEID
jgi:hypothetical protein